MEGEQKRVFLILAEDEIAGIQPPKGVYFTKFLATAQELWVSKKAAKQKENPYMLIGRSMHIPVYLCRLEKVFQRYDQNESGQRKWLMSCRKKNENKRITCENCYYKISCLESSRKYPCRAYQERMGSECSTCKEQEKKENT